MIAIAGGIVVAVLFLALLPSLLLAAGYAVLTLLALGGAALVIWGAISAPITALCWLVALAGIGALMKISYKYLPPTEGEICLTRERAEGLLWRRRQLEKPDCLAVAPLLAPPVQYSWPAAAVAPIPYMQRRDWLDYARYGLWPPTGVKVGRPGVTAD